VTKATVVPTLHKSVKVTLYGAFGRIRGFIAPTIALLGSMAIKKSHFLPHYAPKRVAYEVVCTKIGRKAKGNINVPLVAYNMLCYDSTFDIIRAAFFWRCGKATLIRILALFNCGLLE
jgi:hypothetical protein